MSCSVSPCDDEGIVKLDDAEYHFERDGGTSFSLAAANAAMNVHLEIRNDWGGACYGHFTIVATAPGNVARKVYGPQGYDGQTNPGAGSVFQDELIFLADANEVWPAPITGNVG